MILFYKTKYLVRADYGIPIFDLIKKIFADENTFSKVSVAPLMCGAGKSTAISYIICSVLQNRDNTDGILIVTDSISRMMEYIQPNRDIDPHLRAYLDDNRERIALLQYGDDWNTAKKECEERPVLIISTQRYFQSTKKQIEKKFLRWKNGCRSLILFDEHIPLKDVVQIDRTSINKVASALCDRIEYSLTGPENEERVVAENTVEDALDEAILKWAQKKWCVNQWEQVRKKIYSKIEQLERLFALEDYYLYCNWSLPSMTADDDRFMKYIERSKRFLISAEGNVLKKIKAVRAMMTSGAIYHCQKREGQYESVFSIVIDNTELVTDLSLGGNEERRAKVIVLDGTGNIHPDTAFEPLPEHIDMRNEEAVKYRRWLDNLTIHVVDFGTARSSLTGPQSTEKKKCICNYLNQLGTVDDTLPEHTKPVVFTYMQIEKYFANAGFKTEHFNNIKGKNDYRNERLIAQVGLNRMPGWYALSYYLANHPEWREELEHMEVKSTNEAIIDKLVDDNGVLDIHARLLLADVEQNMFRCAIRQLRFIHTAHYYILTKKNDREYRRLLELMHERYDSLRVQIVEEEMPAEFRSAWADTSNIGKVLKYLLLLPAGKEVTKEEIVKGSGLASKEQFDNTRKNKKMDRFIKRLKIPGSHKYSAPTQEDWDSLGNEN